jgi:hypothetical protein
VSPFGSRQHLPRRGRGWVLLAVLAALLTTSAARANGRFPRSQRLLEDPSNPEHLLLAATYGLLTTTDGGGHWYDFCEAEFAGSDTYAGDPLIDWIGGGDDGGPHPTAALVDVQSAISRTADFCGWSPVLGSFDSTENINDFAVERANPSTVVAVATSLVDGGTSISLRESTDAGATWQTIGSPLPLLLVSTIDLDPSDATHIYASGLVRAASGEEGVLLESTDQGTTWTTTPIPNTDASNVPYIAAIGPDDAKKIFVRTDSFTFPADAPEEVADDALLYSADGGASWTEILRQNAKLLGFALSPDGTTVLAGYGDPVESGYAVDPTVTGIYMASTSDLTFTAAPAFAGSVTCLTWTQRGVYACTAQSASGSLQELAFFEDGDLSPDGAAPAYLMTLDQVAGPPPCCAAAASACDWSSICATYQFFDCADGGAPAVACTDGGVTAAPANDGGSAADAGGDGSVAGGSSSAGRESRSGCACRTSAASQRVDGGVVLLGAGVLSALARRRRQRGGARRT